MDFLAGQDVLSYLRENSVIIRPQLILILWGLAILCVVPLLRTNRTTWPLVYSLLGLLMASISVWSGDAAGPAFNGMISFDYFARYFHFHFHLDCQPFRCSFPIVTWRSRTSITGSTMP